MAETITNRAGGLDQTNAGTYATPPPRNTLKPEAFRLWRKMVDPGKHAIMTELLRCRRDQPARSHVDLHSTIITLDKICDE